MTDFLAKRIPFYLGKEIIHLKLIDSLTTNTVLANVIMIKG